MPAARGPGALRGVGSGGRAGSGSGRGSGGVAAAHERGAAAGRVQRARAGAVPDRATEGAVALARAREGGRAARHRSRGARHRRAGAGCRGGSGSGVAPLNAECGMWIAEWQGDRRSVGRVSIPHSEFHIPHYLSRSVTTGPRFQYRPPDFAAPPLAGAPDAHFEPAPADGVLPERFFSTTNLPTYVKAGRGPWRRPRLPRMDCVVVLHPPADLVVTEPRKVKKGQLVAGGTDEDGR